MKCLICGAGSNNYLCETHTTEAALAEIFDILRFYREELCDNEHIRELATGFERTTDVRSCIPEILKLFPDTVSDYYYCRYYKIARNPGFEDAALGYLDSHAQKDEKWQYVLYDLIDFWQRDDFVKPRKWCETIRASENLAMPLYRMAVEYFSMVGDYDIADEIIDRALALCSDESYDNFLFSTRDNMTTSLTQFKETIHKYRTKRPYWPSTEQRRRALASVYDEKGIEYPRIGAKPKKVKESDFVPLEESDNTELSEYSAFWCAAVFNMKKAVKGFYQIAAVKVRDGEVADEFQSFVKFWEGTAGKEAAAKEAGIDVGVLDSADHIDVVMNRFFSFVGGDTLVSTDALGNQAKMISRAARYTGMNRVGNKFLDLLDYAADASTKFDMENNTREYLLKHFVLSEGKDSLEKAKVNIELYNRLKA